MKVTLLATQSYLTLWPHKLYSPPGSSVHRISQAKILEWVAISFSRGSSWPRDWIPKSPPWHSDSLPLGHLESPWIPRTLGLHPFIMRASALGFPLLAFIQWIRGQISTSRQQHKKRPSWEPSLFNSCSIPLLITSFWFKITKQWF